MLNKFANVFEVNDVRPNAFINCSDMFDCYNNSIEISEIEQAILTIKSNACGSDKILGKIYRSFSSSLSIPLYIIFNTSLIQKRFTSNWKIANVIPLPKGK